MSHDPHRVADTQAWLRKAAADLRGAEIDLSATPPLLGDAAFHCQQASEKAQKGFLAWHDAPFRKTHDLAELGHQCVSIDSSLESICRRAERLTSYSWIFRYPGGPEGPTREEADEALALASEVYKEILARLPAEVRP
jgi:HEPN domain-containing protein